jgi:hypothetical protein
MKPSEQRPAADQPIVYTTTDIIGLQRQLAPSLYGKIDLTLDPERFRRTLGENSILRKKPRIQALLADQQKVEFFRQLTLMGDPLADALAARVPDLGFKKIRGLLDEALEKGVDQVPDAPPELVALMRAVEHVPAWVDRAAIDRAGARARALLAMTGEAILRLGFMMTYVNGYQGLPMVITGALTSESAAKRMTETISTFKMATLPGALERGGLAWRSAVKVRLMHAMVRTHLLRHPETWDYRVYGVPIPQVDQMGAALGPTHALARRALRRGTGFTPREKDAVEQARYVAYLLGMHSQFLSNDPQQIVDTWQMCQATLKHQFDPRGKQLNDATLNAYRRPDKGWFNRVVHELDVRSTRFMYNRMVGAKTASTMGVPSDWLDVAGFAALALPVGLGYAGLEALRRFPATRAWADGYAIMEINRQLAAGGDPAYRTDASHYRMGRSAKGGG